MNRLRHRSTGFTLLELVVTIAIIGILAAIAIPQYTAYIRRGYRGQARAALMQASQTAERYRGEKNTYVGLTLGATAAYVPDNSDAASGKYSIVASNLTGGTYTITATAINGQTADECTVFTIDQTGAKTTTNSGTSYTSGAPYQICWGR